MPSGKREVKLDPDAREPKRSDSARLTPVALAREVTVGDTTVHWLSAVTSIPEDALEQGLHPEEQLLAQGMRSPMRREEFCRARYLIRKLTGAADPVLRLPSGLAQWPEGFIGSITHKHGAVGVALEEASMLYGLGIDVEDTRINLKLESRIVQASESRLLDQVASRAEGLAVAFSFKEAIFKACFPQGKTMFYFHDAEIVAFEAHYLMARLLCDVGPQTPASTLLRGDYCFIDDKDATGLDLRFACTAVRIIDHS